MKGFYLKELRMVGEGKTPAVISFTRGANIITGVSDAGKSYIFSVLNYVLGRSVEPKNIAEGIGYTDIYLEIRPFKSDTAYTLFRRIGQNRIGVKRCQAAAYLTSNAEVKVYQVKGQLNNDHIAQFLLSFCGLSDKKLLKNKSGVTISLGISDLLKLTFIPEDRIITENSPFYFSDQFMKRTSDQSLLRLLLTGDDYTGTTPKESKEVRETRIKGKLEFIAYQLGAYAQQRDALVKRLNDLNKTIDGNPLEQLEHDLRRNISEAQRLTETKNGLIKSQEAIMAEVNNTEELLWRFQTLERQYRSDSQRLEFILEAEVLSSQLSDVICPVCTSPLDENHLLHIQEMEGFRSSALEELQKIAAKLNDLTETITDLKEFRDRVNNDYVFIQHEITTLENELNENFSPNIRKLEADFYTLRSIEQLSNEVSFIDKEIDKLYLEKDRLGKSLLLKAGNKEDIDFLPYSKLSKLSDFIEDRLKKWHYEPHIKVVFDSHPNTFDIVISGKSRRSYGKGKRSISYAACLMGLLDYCQSEKTNFSNLIVLDSPLTTLEEKQGSAKDPEVELTIQNSFFKDLTTLPQTCQVIIFDNKQPSPTIKKDITKRVNMVIFTGDKQIGRAGFFPV